MVNSRVLSVLGLLSLFSSSVRSHNVVEQLTPENFEHLTQAASGATTGTWLVYFAAKGVPRPFVDVFSAAAEVLHQQQHQDHNDRKRVVLPATVACRGNQFWCRERFGVVEVPNQGISELLAIFHNGQQYNIRENLDEITKDVVLEFAEKFQDEEFRKAHDVEFLPEVVPELTMFTVLKIEVLKSIELWDRIVNKRLAALITLFVTGTILGLLLGCCCCSGKKKPKTKKTTDDKKNE